MKEAERWIGNGLATLLAGGAVAAGVIGLLLAFGYINDEGSVNHFQDGLVWLTLGVILGIAANVFRREHSIADEGSRNQNVSEWRRVDDRDQGRDVGARVR